MTEPKISNHYKLGTILFQQGIALSCKELRNYVREYNNWEMPISIRIQHIIIEPNEFIKFIKENKI